MNKWIFLCKLAESKIAEFKMAAIINLSWECMREVFFVQNGWIQEGRIQDGRIKDACHHQVSQMELVWVRVRVEGDCFWVKLREDNKVSESNMALSESNMAEFRMAAIIKLSQNEWVKVFFVQHSWKPFLDQVEWECMSLSQDWTKFELRVLCKDGQIQDDSHHQVKWEWMSLSQIEVSLSRSQNGVRVFLSESERR